MSSKKAALYNPYWPTLGGGERYSATVAACLLQAGWQVDIWWPENLIPSLENRFNLNLTGAKFTSHHPSFEYDLLFWLSDGSLPWSFARRTLIHLQYPFSGIGGHRLINLVKSRRYTFVVNSRFTADHVNREFSVRSQVLYPPVNTPVLSENNKLPQILYVGRFSSLTQAKGHHHLIQAFARLHPQLPRWRLILAGGLGVGADPAYISSLQAQAHGLPVEFIFNPDWQQLCHLYSKSSVFWTASGYGINSQIEPLKVEHFGLSLVEAMAAGAVPLAYAGGGHPEIITEACGILWKTPEELITQTLYLAKHPQLRHRYSQAAQKRSTIFSVDHFNSRLLSLIA